MLRRRYVPTQDHTTLALWPVVCALRDRGFAITAPFAKSGHRGLAGQIRDSADLMLSRIVDGSTRSDSEFVTCLRTSVGALDEFERRIMVAARLNLFSLPENTPLIREMREVRRELSALIRELPYR
jgi:four helix bundle protein